MPPSEFAEARECEVAVEGRGEIERRRKKRVVRADDALIDRDPLERRSRIDPQSHR